MTLETLWNQHMYFKPLMVFQDVRPYLSTAIVSAPPPTPATPTQPGVSVMKENNDLGGQGGKPRGLGQRVGARLSLSCWHMTLEDFPPLLSLYSLFHK